MQFSRVLKNLSAWADSGVISKDIVAKGRIFDLGKFIALDHDDRRIVDVVDGLKSHVGQPFEEQPWVYCVSSGMQRQSGMLRWRKFVGLVEPRSNGEVFVRECMAMPNGFLPLFDFWFSHTDTGTRCMCLRSHLHEGFGHLGEFPDNSAEAVARYPLAIALLNTRGCAIDQRPPPRLINKTSKRKGKPKTPGHYTVDSKEYLTALGASASQTIGDGSHASPKPHLRRAHERRLADGRRLWIPSALVNVRKEGDIAFVERRKAYVGSDLL
ncbi:hypothetical protein J7382_09900 [Shimia sp. R11_0]|uniref:hypothetical protein n=1 Tax=Shimia sp. R11_0 TaxID=2821096 RepID=UPI001ADD36C5|nr:hypothetical protein [Shimia sp. R11_0]MBO9477848.1 hypothetical protein [Shimia sp. R11_0]